MKTTFEFEVNTDAFLVDPDWEVFADQHDHRYGLAIKHFKSLVKGDAYDNEVMKLRVGRSPGGFRQPFSETPPYPKPASSARKKPARPCGRRWPTIGRVRPNR